MKLFVTSLVLLAAACGQKEPPKSAPKQAYQPFPDADRFTLPADPGAALSVKEAKEKGSGEEVTVVGRVKGIVKGYATFNLIDASLKYCGEVPGSMSDKTPWDYCCDPADVVAGATITVDARGADGQLLRGAIPYLRLLDMVVVKGKVEKDQHGNVTIVATGWFRRERPELPKDLRWPE